MQYIAGILFDIGLFTLLRVVMPVRSLSPILGYAFIPVTLAMYATYFYINTAFWTL